MWIVAPAVAAHQVQDAPRADDVEPGREDWRSLLVAGGGTDCPEPGAPALTDAGVARRQQPMRGRKSCPSLSIVKVSPSMVPLVTPAPCHCMVSLDPSRV